LAYYRKKHQALITATATFHSETSLSRLKTGNYNKVFVYQWRLSTKLI
jgi:hypothetical protein